jgi:phosphotransferase system, enzyme I, PtsP
MAMGYDVLSMNATNLPKVKKVIRNITLEQAEELLDEVMSQEDTESVNRCLERGLEKVGFTRLLGIPRAETRH